MELRSGRRTGGPCGAWAMELRSGRRIGSQSPHGDRRRCRPRRLPAGDGDGVDHISGLHDDQLLQVLARLRCARAAVRTGILSRRWRGLWTRVPELYFESVAPAAVEAVLAQVALPKLSRLGVDVPHDHSLSAAGVASLLRAAARLDPVVFTLAAYVDANYRYVAVEVPSFLRATSISLAVHNLCVSSTAPGGGFPALERLYVAHCCFDAVALISRCPCLRLLDMRHCWGSDTIMVHSRSIEELVIEEGVTDVDINAPMLKKFNLRAALCPDFSMSLSAPMVDNHSWDCSFGRAPVNLAIDGVWCLRHLKLWTKESSRVLNLFIRRPVFSERLERSLQEMFPLPKFSVLELYLVTRGHVYGAMVLNLLHKCNAIQKLKMIIVEDEWPYEACPPNCDCDQPQNWRSQNFSLRGPKELKIKNFKGSGHEVDFLKLIFRCTPVTKVVVKLASKVSPSSSGCKEVYNIFKENPYVESHVYRKRGKEVI
ncbi:hypothetical protein ACP70R_005361 [Stipagrostis hirtigluma subsp. patula]